MAEHYCEQGDLEDRLTKAGFSFVADRDTVDGVVSEDELADYIDTAIEETDTEIDAEIQLLYDTAAARGNRWLKWIAVDIAVARAFTNGGREAPTQMLEERDRARKQLERVRSGDIAIPGLVPSIPQASGAVGGTIRVAELTT